MRERDPVTRIDVGYPFDKTNEIDDSVVERFLQPPEYDVQFLFNRGRKGLSNFRILALRIDKDEPYSINIRGDKTIKNVLNMFNHEYVMMVDNLRLMGGNLVLLNPVPSSQIMSPMQMMQISNNPSLKAQDSKISGGYNTEYSSILANN